MSGERRDSARFGALRKYKRLWPLALCLLLGVVLLILGGGEREETVADGTEGSLLSYEHALAAELSELCSSIEGVGECRVKVTLAASERTEYEGSRVSAVYAPVVQAVTVVCEGAESERVRGMLCELLSAHLSVGTHRITVLPLKNR